ncbi:MBL fold metallo-hydrolase [Terrilactibacillus sp. S3-3]|nr:MBL fold metallo-hydrolase [Terrilactibacillus sp. S3-3]
MDEGIEMLDLSMDLGERQMVVHPTVVYDSDGYVLVDTGMPGFAQKIKDLIEQSGIPASEPRAIILTHQDIDHIGSLPQFLAESRSPIDVYIHENDKPYLDGEKPFIKLRSERKRAILQSLPEKQRSAFEHAFSASTPSVVSHPLKDEERLPFAGGLTVIHTPGHTPGHISLYHEPSQTLIAGDALVVQDGQLLGPNPANTRIWKQRFGRCINSRISRLKPLFVIMAAPLIIMQTSA